jgi:hypothetical protein
MGSFVPRPEPFRAFICACTCAFALTWSTWSLAHDGRVIVVAEAPAEEGAKKLEEELLLLDYSVERQTDVDSSLKRLRSHDVDAVIVYLEPGRSKYYVLRGNEVLVETALEDSEHPDAVPLKTAEGVRSTLRAEGERAVRPILPAQFELSLSPSLDGASYARPRPGLEVLALFRLSDRLYVGPRIKADLMSDYREEKSELGATTGVLAATACTPLALAPVVTIGVCGSLGVRALWLGIITGGEKGQTGGQIWGPLLGGAFFARLDVSRHFALRTSLNFDAGFGSYTGPEMLPKRSTDLLADHGGSSYFGLDFGLGLGVVYLVR